MWGETSVVAGESSYLDLHPEPPMPKLREKTHLRLQATFHFRVWGPLANSNFVIPARL